MKPEHDIPGRDELLARLGELPERDLDPARADEIRALARRALAETEAPRSWREVAAAVYGRALEPALVVGVSGIYLVWAFRTVNALLMTSGG
jgi:hypothetical protein